MLHQQESTFSGRPTIPRASGLIYSSKFLSVTKGRPGSLFGFLALAPPFLKLLLDFAFTLSFLRVRPGDGGKTAGLLSLHRSGRNGSRNGSLLLPAIVKISGQVFIIGAKLDQFCQANDIAIEVAPPLIGCHQISRPLLI